MSITELVIISKLAAATLDVGRIPTPKLKPISVLCKGTWLALDKRVGVASYWALGHVPPATSNNLFIFS